MIVPNTVEGRTALIQDQIRKLQRETPGLSYHASFEKCRQSEELKPVFAAMQQPEALAGPGRDPKKVKAGAKFKGMVEAAARARGITFDAAWNSLRQEEPELFLEMSGNDDPSQRAAKQDPWRTA